MLMAIVAVECLRADGTIRSRKDVAKPFMDDVDHRTVSMLCKLANMTEPQLRASFGELFDDAIFLLRQHQLKPFWME